MAVDQTGPPERPARVEQVILICIPAVVASVVLYLLYFYLEGAWQLLAVAGGGLLALAGLGISLLLSRLNLVQASVQVLFLSLLVVLGVAPLFVQGLSIAMVVSASLLIRVAGSELLPGRWATWLAASLLFAAYVWLIELAPPISRYSSGASGLPVLFPIGATGLFLAVILWHAVLASRRAVSSIRARLLISSLLLVLLTGGAVTYFSTIVLMREERGEVTETLNAVATLKASQIELWAADIQTGLEVFVAHVRPQLDVVLSEKAPEPDSYDEAFRHLQGDLTDTFTHSRLYNGLGVIGTDGSAIVSAGKVGYDAPHLDAEFLQQVLKHPGVQPPRYFPSLRRTLVVVTEPVTGSSGRTLGIVVAYAGLDVLDRIAEVPSGLGLTGKTYMVGADHTILTSIRSTPTSLPSGSPTASLTEGSDAALKRRASGSGFYTDFRGVPVVGVYHWLPSLEAALMAEQDQAEAFQRSTKLIDVYLGITIIVLATATVTVVYLVRSITVPLRRLVGTAERIAGGDMNLTAQVRQGDEIGVLAQAFNDMTGRLRKARDQLEQRVEQRTEELAKANEELSAENHERKRVEEALQLERNRLKSILNAMEDSVYIVNHEYEIEYANPALTRKFGRYRQRKCYSYLYGLSEPCEWCPNEDVWKGRSAHREDSFPDGTTYEVLSTPLPNADGSFSKLAMFHDVTARKEAEAEIMQRNRELAVLSRRLVEVQENERHYISQELHDETGQALISLMLRLGALERDLQRGERVASRVAELKITVEQVLKGLHDLAMDLRPASLDHVGLVPALRQYTERITEQHGLAIDFGAVGLDEERLPPEMEVMIYRIVQEALANVVRHANATHADVIVERRAEAIRILVEDNGIGMDTSRAVDSGHLGLLGIRERAEMLRGRLVIESTPGAGTTILVEAPCDGSHPDS